MKSKFNLELLTVQEHGTIASTMREFENEPYIPIAVQKGMSIEECDSKRQSIGKYEVGSGALWNQKYFECFARLEKLDDNGRTVLDPALIEVGFFYDEIKDLSHKFPYVRENNPRVEIKND